MLEGIQSTDGMQEQTRHAGHITQRLQIGRHPAQLEPVGVLLIGIAEQIVFEHHCVGLRAGFVHDGWRVIGERAASSEKQRGCEQIPNRARHHTRHPMA